MFEQLFGGQLVEKILFYMIVNEKCYASELRRSFFTSISGIQGALTRLESQGILVSIVEGKNRIYYWNPRYPFLENFKKFISEAYSTLPDDIKKKYYERPIRKRPRKKGKPL